LIATVICLVLQQISVIVIPYVLRLGVILVALDSGRSLPRIRKRNLTAAFGTDGKH
jgi:hypothetical protein